MKLRISTVYLLRLYAMITTMALIGGVFGSSATAATTYYVATKADKGNDANPGTQEAPFGSIKHGASMLKAGDTLRIRGGTYTESFTWANKTGESWDTPITIEANLSEIVTWNAPPVHEVFKINNVHFAIVRGIIFDGTGGTNSLIADGYTQVAVSGSMRLISIDCTDSSVPSTCSTDLRFERNVLRNSAYTGAAINCEVCKRIVWSNNEIYNIGKTFGNTAFYSAAPDITYDGNYIHDIMCSGINVWNQNNVVADNVIVRNNRLERTGICWAPTAENGNHWQNGGPRCVQGTINPYCPAIFISRGSGTQVYNNIIVAGSSGIYAGENVQNCLIYNNTVHGNGAGSVSHDDYMAGIALSNLGGGSRNCAVRNNIVYQPGVTSPPPITNLGTDNIFSNNLCSSVVSGLCHGGNPNFAKEENNDLRLQSTSTLAIDRGFDVSATLTSDILATSRPQGGRFDIGAYEYHPSGSHVYSLTTLKSSYSPGEVIAVSWTVSPGPGNPKDWIGFYLSSETDNKKFLAKEGAGLDAWIYTNNQNAGTFSITAIPTPGTYEFRYLLDEGYTQVATSPKISITLSSETKAPSRLRIIP